jgi:hypothetical protein
MDEWVGGEGGGGVWRFGSAHVHHIPGTIRITNAATT